MMQEEAAISKVDGRPMSSPKKRLMVAKEQAAYFEREVGFNHFMAVIIVIYSSAA